MIYRGRLTESEKRADTTLLNDAARPWRVTCDPSRMFLRSTFRVSDLSAGGFDQGTTFVHIRTGETCVVGVEAIARKVFREKARKRRRKMLIVKPVNRVTGNGGANAIL